MAYNKKTWANGDLITKESMNNIENGIYKAHDEIETLKNNTSTGGSNNASDISITDTGNYFTNSDVEGALQEVGSQIKEIANNGNATFNKIEVLEEDPTDNLYEGRIWIYSPVTYTITNNLVNCTTSNMATTVLKNNSYTATITANDNYDLGTITVTMGGEDISSTSVSNGLITISSVTGDIVITCTAISNLVACTGITLDTTTLTFTNTDTQTLTATVTPDGCTDTITWSTSSPSVATVNNGVVTPKGNGDCTITATCGNYSATCNVTVSGLSEVTTPTPILSLSGSNFSNNEQTTTLPDNSGNGNNFTASGFNYTTSSGSNGNGGIVADGTNDKLMITSFNNISGANGYSIILKCSINNLSQTKKYFVEFDGTGIGAMPQLSVIYGYSSKCIQFYDGKYIANINIAISDTNVHTIAFTYDGTNLVGYLDGTKIGSAAITNNLTGNFVRGSIFGSADKTSECVNATMYELRLYDKGLTEAQISNITTELG